MKKLKELARDLLVISIDISYITIRYILSQIEINKK